MIMFLFLFSKLEYFFFSMTMKIYRELYLVLDITLCQPPLRWLGETSDYDLISHKLYVA